uniref:B30.2/SPRY domain-containing protein n=1 Tax=Acrobeloides nanus TaxID=290746 RepID=A0A914CUM6_9BILA
MANIPIEIWLEPLKFLPGNENFPSELNPEDAYSTLKILPDKLSVEFTGPNNSYWESAGCVRANVPVPRALGLFYFEVTIIKDGPNSEEIYRSVGVGLGQKNVPLQNMPGWRYGSYGYHGDDGKFYQNGRECLYGETFTTNNVIGCGVNFVKMELFYMKNGQYIGVAKKGRFREELYPFVGLNAPGEIIEEIEDVRKIQVSENRTLSENSTDSTIDFSSDDTRSISSNESENDFDPENELENNPDREPEN